MRILSTGFLCVCVTGVLFAAPAELLADEGMDTVVSGSVGGQTEDSENSTDDEVQPPEIEERRADEAALNEDPEAQRRARRLASEQPTEEGSKETAEPKSTGSLELYASVRVHAINNYDVETGSHSAKVGDGNSRAGLRAEWEFQPGWYLFGRAELGFNILDSFTTRANEGGDDGIETRLAYAGVDQESFAIVLGKNWSAYYQVAGTTDRFAIFGGSASGIYNAGTTGEATGTGRAEEVLQARLYMSSDHRLFRNIKPFNLHLQYQRGQPIPTVDGEEYDYSYGASAFLETNNEYAIGIAYNIASVPEGRMAIQDAGIDGDATALAVATRAYGDRWYAGLLVSRLENMETTDQRRYFNGTGVEIYSQWEFKKDWWLIGGANLLDPDDDDPDAGQYRVRYAVIGGRYSIDSFKRMIYVEYRLDEGRLADGRPAKDELTVGIRWDFGE